MTGSKRTFDPDTDVPDLAGKVDVLTIGSAGIGIGVAARLLQHHAACIHLLGASDAGLAEAAADLRRRLLHRARLQGRRRRQAGPRRRARRAAVAADGGDCAGEAEVREGAERLLGGRRSPSI